MLRLFAVVSRKTFLLSTGKNLFFAAIFMVSCQSYPLIEYSPAPTPPDTIPELIEVLSGDNDVARIGAAYALASKGSTSAPAVPALIENLYYDGVYDVREASAAALGAIGPVAKQSVPDLINVLNNDFIFVRRAAAGSLGQIGDTSAVPFLVMALDDDDSGVAILVAKSIEVLTNQEFPGRYGDNAGHLLDENGIPIIALAAKEWWEKEGQYQEWPDLPAAIPTSTP